MFDILIHNDDRNLTNILWAKEDFMMQVHRPQPGLSHHGKAAQAVQERLPWQVSDLLLRERLQALNKDGPRAAAVSLTCTRRQIEAILARRDLILKEAVGTSR